MKQHKLLIFWLNVKIKWKYFLFPIQCKLQGKTFISQSYSIGQGITDNSKPRIMNFCFTQEMIDDIKNIK